MTDNDFYKTKTWELIMNELNQLNAEIKSLRTEISDLKVEMNNLRLQIKGIMKWTAGVVAVISFIFYFLKDWFVELFKKITRI